MKISKELSKHFSELGKKGATNRWAKMTTEERIAYSRMMNKARNAKRLKDMEAHITVDNT